MMASAVRESQQESVAGGGAGTAHEAQHNGAPGGPRAAAPMDPPPHFENVGVCARWCGDTSMRALMFYFWSSICLTVFNKWFFSSHNPLGFHFPLTVTCIHQAFVYLLIVATEPQLKTSGFGDIVRSPGLRVPLGILGAFCGIDWGLSNLSLRYIPLSLYEMTKSGSPAMVLILTFFFGLLAFTKRVLAIVLLISVGMFLAVSGGSVAIFHSEDFPMFGFLCVSVATVLSGARIVYAQHALQRIQIPGHDAPGVNAVTMLYYSAPSSSVALILPAVLLEGPEIRRWAADASPSLMLNVAFWVVLSASIAYLLSLSEFFATRQTSALTLCVVGVVKQLLLIGLAMVLFGDKLGIVNIIGVMVALSGVFLYNYGKRTGMIAKDAGPPPASTPDLSPNAADEELEPLRRSTGIDMPSAVVSSSRGAEGTGSATSSNEGSLHHRASHRAP